MLLLPFQTLNAIRQKLWIDLILTRTSLSPHFNTISPHIIRNHLIHPFITLLRMRCLRHLIGIVFVACFWVGFGIRV